MKSFNPTIVQESEKTLLAALDWASGCFKGEIDFGKEETMLLGRTVSLSAEILMRERDEI